VRQTVWAYIKGRSGILFIPTGNSLHVINVTGLGVEKETKALTLCQLFLHTLKRGLFLFPETEVNAFASGHISYANTHTYVHTPAPNINTYITTYIYECICIRVHVHTYVSLYNKIVMMLREIIVTQCPDRALHRLVAGSTNFAGR
jgi:hypothetical protein